MSLSKQASPDDQSYDPYWTFVMALTWIVSRDISRVNAVAPDKPESRNLSRFPRSRRYVEEPEDALDSLWRNLQEGTLRASGKTWQGRRDIEPRDWCDLIRIDLNNHFRKFIDGSMYQDRMHMVASRPSYRNVRICAANILKVYPPQTEGRVANQMRRAPEALSTRKATKVLAVQETLSQLFPSGRPQLTGFELLRRLSEQALNLGTISPRTLTRAITQVWPATKSKTRQVAPHSERQTAPTRAK